MGGNNIKLGLKKKYIYRCGMDLSGLAWDKQSNYEITVGSLRVSVQGAKFLVDYLVHKKPFRLRDVL
jgi:hypothetical protein